ncbi:zinc ribbon domain-containing protein [Saliphagus sp. LR7]|uniref:double zinc ribbon domain-containing protein n=1 Tax=Saliphagus sp. LR7 TaxID=2282654 RepID=UPI000DF832FE|nr:zinc ribbon domain-containing protein [Saliphagus sp. LR7]
MSKITFRADDDLVEGIEAFDASKSEVMREALRAYLEDASRAESRTEVGTSPSIDDLVRERVDERVEDRLDERVGRRAPDVDVSISLEGLEGVVREDAAGGETNTTVRKTEPADEASDGATPVGCTQCGETLAGDHVYCPNCGEKASRRAFCECGDELRSDWSFCPGCGRRTPAADVLDPDRRPG